MSNKQQSPVVVFAKKPSIVATQVALALMGAQVAYAQQPVQTAERVERVEITGTRLPQLSTEGPSPVTVMDAQEIRMDGLAKTEDLLNNLPQVYAAQGSNASNGATGTANVNLRNLGPTRNLVLMNGRRLPAGSPRSGAQSAAADLNQIPAPLIQRVELLTGGASAVYGSDAITGVVNFIMNDRFEGVQVDLNWSGYNHEQHSTDVANVVAARAATNPSQFAVPGDIGADGQVRGVSVLMGRNFADNKGNATLFFNYKKEDAVLQRDRDFSACALNPGNRFTCGGSGTSYPGYFYAFSASAYNVFTIANAAGTARAFNPNTDLFNFGPYNYYRRPSEQYGFNAFAHLDVHPKVRTYGEFGFHDNRTDAQIAPSGSFFSQQTIFADNPLLSPSVRAAIAAGDPAFGPPGSSAQLLIGRRNIEGGGRDDDIRHTSYRGVLGAKGEVTKNWNYDAFMQTARVLYQETYRNDFSNVRLGRSLDVITNPVGGAPACRSAVPDANGVVVDPNCVPYDIWHIGGVTPQALSYLQTPGLQNGETRLHVFGANIQGDLAPYGVKLPGARDGLAVAVGFERRKESLTLQTDTEFESNDLAGQGGATLSVKGNLDVDEWFGEARLPLLQRQPFADLLSINGSYRHSDYSTNISTNTYGAGIEWAPVRSFRLRGSYQKAVRHANIQELFQPQGTNLFGLSTGDPCGPALTATLAQCANTGITAANYGNAILRNPAGQYNYLQGGNPLLKPEEAKTYTFGLVMNPIRSLTATVDWYSILIEDAIGIAPPSTLLQQCLQSGQFCSSIHRDALGTLWVTPAGRIDATNLNLGAYYTNGIDLGVNWTTRMGNMGGLGLNLLGSWVNTWRFEPIKGAGNFDCVGLFGPQCGTPIPEWRHKARATWATPWNLDLALTWRYIGEAKHEGTSSQPLLHAAGGVALTDQKLKDFHYFDIAANWTINKTFTLRGGVNNIFDVDPPIISNVTADPSIFGNGNTFPQVYDTLGRLLFVNLTMKF